MSLVLISCVNKMYVNLATCGTTVYHLVRRVLLGERTEVNYQYIIELNVSIISHTPGIA